MRGKRSGDGISIYDGKFGNDRWIGPFTNDVAHGKGTMILADKTSKVEMEFVMG